MAKQGSHRRTILVLFYSLGGGVSDLAREVGRGAQSVPNTKVEIKRVPELISEQVFAKNPKLLARKKRVERSFPIATVDDLARADGVAIGTPVHFGSFASQIKQFIDQLSPVWHQRKMINKPAAVFCATGTLHGGEEIALTSLMMPLFHLGMIPVGLPYPTQGHGSNFDAGSPYGAIFVNRAGEWKGLTADERKIGRILGRRLALMTHLMSCTCATCRLLHRKTR